MIAVLLVAGAVALVANAAPTHINAVMTGAKEVPGPGDPDGKGRAHFSFNVTQNKICFNITVQDIGPATAAHIHSGTGGVAGPVVVALTPPTDGNSVGCAQSDQETIDAIRNHPDLYYVNVHNADYPGGALRGQLKR